MLTADASLRQRAASLDAGFAPPGARGADVAAVDGAAVDGGAVDGGAAGGAAA
jgi:hypothetical protein